MRPITASRTINAPLDLVFRSVSDVCILQKAIPRITDVEFLSDQRQGPGTHFRETRIINQKRQTRTCCIFGYVENRSVRFLSNYGCSLWISDFSVGQIESNVVIEVQVYPLVQLSFFANVVTTLTRHRAVRLLECDMDSVKSFCEVGSRRDDS